MTTTILLQIQDRAISHDVFNSFKSVYPDAEYNHIKSTIVVPVPDIVTMKWMENLYKGLRDEYYRWQNMSDTERDHFTDLGQSYENAAAILGQVQEPRIASGYSDQGYTPFVDWLPINTATEKEDKRDNERIAWESIPKVHEVEREAEIQDLLIEATEDEVYWHLQDLLGE
jgi:hypothetical protein